MRSFIFALILIAMMPLNALSQENIRGIFFDNKSPHLLGVRLINRRNRVEYHHIFEPNSKAHVDTKLSKFTLSAQLITSSFPIDCCEWKVIDSGETLTIEYLEDRNRCYCKIK
ncbi:MAG: hypothetical protein C0603_05700 [Denitrovibrio sp.]|nr:MAG: hypothetical protein C0603_05700 [Denitrovibrio sp.]